MKKIFVVLETTGGWGGTYPHTNVYYAFRSSEEAEAYCAKRKAQDKDERNRSRELWEGEVLECELRD